MLSHVQRLTVAIAETTPERNSFALLFTRSRQWWCGFMGHELLLRLEGHRICLECISCGYQSSGWMFDRRTSVMEPSRLERRPPARPHPAALQ
jgi:hypothetical protein